MSTEFTEEIKDFLVEEKKRIEAELSKFAHRKKGGSESEYETEYKDIGNSDDENAAEVTTYSDNLSLENALEKLLRDTIAAIERVEKGEYGVCKYCQSDIVEARLRARPTSSSCIKCKKTLTQEI